MTTGGAPMQAAGSCGYPQTFVDQRPAFDRRWAKRRKKRKKRKIK